jgi:ribosome-associated protein
MELAVRTLVAHKALEPVILKVKEFCSFADFFIVCAGTSRRQVLALAQHLEEALAQAGVKPLGVEGIQEGLWVLLDYNAVVIHIFYQPLREFYNLEGLWAEAPELPLSAISSEDPRAFAPQKAIMEPHEDPKQTRHD